MITSINEFRQIRESSEKGTIYFRNKQQKALWDNELAGQISDGYWENSPGSNWKFWTGLKTDVDSKNPRVDARTSGRVGFNLANKELLDAVGDRMLSMAKMSFVTSDEKIIKASEYLEGIDSEEKLHKFLSTASDYYKNRLNEIGDDEFQEWLKVKYDMKQMIADLKDMSAIMKTANGSSMKTDEKDVDRIKGIVDKAKGDKDKEVQLAANMANSIDDGIKALRRGQAAENMGHDHIAKPFLDRAKALGAMNESVLNENIVHISEDAKNEIIKILKPLQKHYDFEYSTNGPNPIIKDGDNSFYIRINSYNLIIGGGTWTSGNFFDEKSANDAKKLFDNTDISCVTSDARKAMVKHDTFGKIIYMSELKGMSSKSGIKIDFDNILSILNEDTK